MSAPQANEAEKNIEIWKVKKLIKRLEAARGNGTSMISLIIRKSWPAKRRTASTDDVGFQHQKIKFHELHVCWLRNSYENLRYPLLCSY